MAARDRYTIDIKCPRCGRGGEAHASENDYPFMRHPGFSLDRLPEGFSVSRGARYRRETVVKCLNCETEFNP